MKDRHSLHLRRAINRGLCVGDTTLTLHVAGASPYSNGAEAPLQQPSERTQTLQGGKEGNNIQDSNRVRTRSQNIAMDVLTTGLPWASTQD